MAPDAAESILNLVRKTANGLVFTDIFRSAESSLHALRTKRGIQAPGYSAHNYGLAFDLDLTETQRNLNIKYDELVDLLAEHGWYCHRRVDRDSSAFEAWHFNWLGTTHPTLYLALAKPNEPRSWSLPIEERIAERYASDWELSINDIQSLLSRTHLYHGPLDGLDGPFTREAVEAFQRAWKISEHGAGPRTKRTLAYVSADWIVEMIPETFDTERGVS